MRKKTLADLTEHYWKNTCLWVGLAFLASCATKEVPPTGYPAVSIPKSKNKVVHKYDWTTDHMHVGVRWQPFAIPGNDAYDATRPVIAKDSSYAQFWVSWAQAEPDVENTDYKNHMSDYLRAIDDAVYACAAQGVKTELVFWHCPAWASVSGKEGPWKPKTDEYSAFVTRIAKHFKGRVESYQLFHEANMRSMLEDGDIDFLISEIFIKGAKAVRRVYQAAPARSVLVSTSGASPCDACPTLAGLEGKGAVAARDYFRRLASNKELMGLVDTLNINVSDHFNGYGMMDGGIIPSVWDSYDLVRKTLDENGHRGKKILSSESWIVWDSSINAVDVNGDGVKNEKDAYDKTVTILGKCVERGLNTINLPWSDNESSWSMGLTKRRDYNGRIKQLARGKVIPAEDQGPDIVTTKMGLKGTDCDFKIKKADESFKIKDYINPPDPNHLHYYVWRWYAQIAGGTDEVIRHAMAGEEGNDIAVAGPGWTGNEHYKIASYNRTKKTFTVLVYSGGANGKSWTHVTIPSTIQNGKYYNNEFSKVDFRGEGFPEEAKYKARIITKNISRETGQDVDVSVSKSKTLKVEDGKLTVPVINMNKFTAIEFSRVD